MKLLTVFADCICRVSAYALDDGADVGPLTPAVPLFNIRGNKTHLALLQGVFQGLQAALNMLEEDVTKPIPLLQFGPAGNITPLPYPLQGCATVTLTPKQWLCPSCRSGLPMATALCLSACTAAVTTHPGVATSCHYPSMRQVSWHGCISYSIREHVVLSMRGWHGI